MPFDPSFLVWYNRVTSPIAKKRRIGLMNEKTGNIARRLVAIGLPLALFLALLFAWSAVADEAESRDGGPALYEIQLAGVEIGRLEVILPAGLEYGGLAAGSQVRAEPQFSEDGGPLIWQGPFAGAEVLRFWLVPMGSSMPPTTLAVVGAEVDAVRVEPATTFPTRRQPTMSAGRAPTSIGLEKEVDPDQLDPSDGRLVTYEVEFTHDTTETVTLERITDTLPSDFFFVGMAAGTDVITEPIQVGDSQYVWEMLSFTDSLTLRYNVLAVYQSGLYQNSVEALSGGDLIGPASATLEIEGGGVLLPVVLRNYTLPIPIWQVTKSADPAQVGEGEPVVYTVVIANVGTYAGTVGSVADTLPEGFTWLGMMPGSDVINPPVGLVGTISWHGPWVVPPGEDLTLIYQVESGGAGDKVNTVVVYGSAGQQLGSASSMITIGGALPFLDDFANGVSPDWQPFLNFAGLSADRWYWAGEMGSWGVYNYGWDRVLPGWTGYDVSIYDGPGAQTWTNYRVEAVVKDVKETGSLKSGLTGIFFRGNYEDSGAMDGKSVGGYYVYLKPSDNRIYLMRTPPDNPSFAAATVVNSYYYAPRIGRKHWYKFIVEVRDANIKVWFQDYEAGTSPIQVFNWTDSQNAWSQGTVGFAAYYTSARFDYIRVDPLE